MKIKQGKEGAYKQFLADYGKTIEHRMDIKFLMQWTTMIEFDLQDGADFGESAKKRYEEIKERDRGLNIPFYLKSLEEIWEHGEQLKDWYNKNGCKTKVKKECVPQGIHLSSHARKRMHTRCGLGKKAQEKIASKAYLEGLDYTDVGCNLRMSFTRLIDHTNDKDKDITELKLYNDKIYLFKTVQNGHLLVTVIPAPTKELKSFRQEQNRKQPVLLPA